MRSRGSESKYSLSVWAPARHSVLTDLG
jgi:hypothetical protein